MNLNQNKLVFCVYLALGLATLVVYWQVRNCDFVNYDDPAYVSENTRVQGGLTKENVIWAFTAKHASNWHPLTWLSHMLDCQLFKTNPSRHHLTNLFLHIINTMLLFAVLRRMTGALWQSAFVAALFALHPLHVESVAWISERKDVLSTLFWLLTMAAYLHYTNRPSTSRYLLTLVTFALGLMAKPMLVTLPFVLLLLDYWPLERLQLQRPHIIRLVLEKIPFFVLSVTSSVVTFFVQQSGKAVIQIARLPLTIRIANAAVSSIEYIVKMFWPSQLAVFYPYTSDRLTALRITVAVLLLLIISVWVICLSSKYKYLLVGWLWYLGTLVPVIGLVQVGNQALADRYTYVPLIGLFIVVTWGSSNLLAKLSYRRTVLAVLSLVILLNLSICTSLQAKHWRDNRAIFEYALNVTHNNYMAHSLLAHSLRQQGEVDQAIAHDNESLRINPEYLPAHAGLGFALVQQGKLDEAVIHFTKALQLDPDTVDIHKSLGNIFSQQGKLEQAVYHFKKALSLEPLDVNVHNLLGIVLGRQGKFDETIKHFNEALRIKPNFTEARCNLGYALTCQSKFDQAVPQFRQAIQLDPNYAQAHYHLATVLNEQDQVEQAVQHFRNALRLKPDWAGPVNGLAWLLATHKEAKFRNSQEALYLAERACELTKYQAPEMLDTLAAAYAAAGDFPKAVATAQKALGLAESAQQNQLAEQIQSRLNLYKEGKPYIEP